MRTGIWSLAWRESRSGRRRLLLYMSAISFGVAALVAIDSFAANVERALREQSRQLVGGDITLAARQGWTPAAESVLEELRQRGATVVKVTTFPSMAVATRNGATRLAQVRAVGDEYPLYGSIATSPPHQWRMLREGRYALVDPGLLLALDARPGDTLALGYARFVIAGSLGNVPGDPGIVSAIGPRIFVHERYLGETRLLQFGSRVDYDALARIASGDPDRIVADLRPRLRDAQMRARTLRQEEADISEGIQLLANFLGVVGIVALLLGGVGVASGVHAWIRSRVATVAILRCVGATSRQVLAMYIAQAVGMGIAGAALGALAGIAVQFALPELLGKLLPVDVQVRVEPAAVGSGIGLGVWIATAFALRPLLALRRVAPLQALRAEQDPAPLGPWWRDPARMAVNALIAGSVVALAATRAERPVEIAAITGMVALALLALNGSAATLTAISRRVSRFDWPYVIRQGMANLHRPGNQTRSVMLSLGFGTFLVSTLYLVQSNLMGQLRRIETEARGNLVFFDVQEDQLSGLDSLIRSAGEEVVSATPLVSMRIASINGQSVSELARDSARSGWGLRREYRSTFRDTLAPTERLIAGRWFRTSSDHGPYEVSLERDIAQSLGVSLGDTIVWDVQGVQVATVVTSVREVNWQRAEPNFFAVFQPAALQRAPKTYVVIARANGDTAVARLQRATVQLYPNVASLDITAVRRVIEGISSRATAAIRFLAIVTLGLSLPVLFAAVSATRRERIREGVLLKTLGATRLQIARILRSEYGALGLLGSLTGMLLSFGGAWLLLSTIFDRAFEPAIGPAMAIAAAMLALTLAIGSWAARDVFRETPMAALRQL
ncbi:MAG TPA: FtsX-like permease family protein [Gemmatimonadaceae bacterium]|nr:FtsX-like permease family protein [Gemmatimonadaceae bacterium]